MSASEPPLKRARRFLASEQPLLRNVLAGEGDSGSDDGKPAGSFAATVEHYTADGDGFDGFWDSESDDAFGSSEDEDVLGGGSHVEADRGVTGNGVQANIGAAQSLYPRVVFDFPLQQPSLAVQDAMLDADGEPERLRFLSYLQRAVLNARSSLRNQELTMAAVHSMDVFQKAGYNVNSFNLNHSLFRAVQDGTNTNPAAVRRLSHEVAQTIAFFQQTQFAAGVPLAALETFGPGGAGKVYPVLPLSGSEIRKRLSAPLRARLFSVGKRDWSAEPASSFVAPRVTVFRPFHFQEVIDCAVRNPLSTLLPGDLLHAVMTPFELELVEQACRDAALHPTTWTATRVPLRREEVVERLAHVSYECFKKYPYLGRTLPDLLRYFESCTARHPSEDARMHARKFAVYSFDVRFTDCKFRNRPGSTCQSGADEYQACEDTTKLELRTSSGQRRRGHAVGCRSGSVGCVLPLPARSAFSLLQQRSIAGITDARRKSVAEASHFRQFDCISSTSVFGGPINVCAFNPTSRVSAGPILGFESGIHAGGRDVCQIACGSCGTDAPVATNLGNGRAGDDRRNCRIFDLVRGTSISLVGHGDKVNWLAYSSDGRKLVTACEDGATRVFDAHIGPQVTGVSARAAEATLQRFTPDDFRGIVVSDNDRLHFVGEGNPSNVSTTSLLDSQFAIFFAQGEAANNVLLWNYMHPSNYAAGDAHADADDATSRLNRRREVVTPLFTESELDTVNNEGLILDGGLLSAGYGIVVDGTQLTHGMAILFDLHDQCASSRIKFKVRGEAGSFDTLFPVVPFSTACGDNIASPVFGTTDTAGTIRLWDTRNNRGSVRSFHSDQLEGNGGACSIDGRFVATGSYDNSIVVFDIRFDKKPPVHVFKHDVDSELVGSQGVSAVVWSKMNSSFLFSGGEDRAVRVWDIRSATQDALITAFPPHQKVINHLALSPCETLVASGADDNVVQLYGVRAAQCVSFQEPPGRCGGILQSD